MNMNEGRKRLRKNLAQDRLERLRSDLKTKRKITEKLEKFNEKPVRTGSSRSTQRTNVSGAYNSSRIAHKANDFVNKFLSNDTVTVVTANYKNKSKFSVDGRLKRARTQVLKTSIRSTPQQSSVANTSTNKRKDNDEISNRLLPVTEKPKGNISPSKRIRKLPVLISNKVQHENVMTNNNKNTGFPFGYAAKSPNQFRVNNNSVTHVIEPKTNVASETFENPNQFEHDNGTFMDVDMEECFAETTSSQAKKSNDNFWSLNDNPVRNLDINDEIQRIRGEPAYLALHHNLVPDVEMKLCVPQGDLLIVVDTNIFLSHLDFLIRLVDCNILSYEKHVLVIPWPVIQELDFATKKSRHEISSAAKYANRFIFECLKKEHPHVFGQSLEDFKLNFKKTVCVDDYVLQYCLKFVELMNNVVLLTDDKNLCNKGMISNIPAYTRQEFEYTFHIDTNSNS